ncbi:hypothetical protein GE061_017102 [Apolygus lucorum]|uniref:SCP domain-containing protein n=1 Tax=Apolygus lucorum TaxID=248454 RepID=A0A8S9XJA4_APOLU|nr:hypothetical protein GE061_017102 [Apolygus lucorum]
MCGDEPENKNSTDAMTDEYRKALMKSHNEFRNTHAGGVIRWANPSNMRQIIWDYTLEKMAKRTALHCPKIDPKEFECRKTPEFPVIGQTYGVISNPRPDDPIPLQEVLKDWIKTRKDAEDDEKITVYELIDSYHDGPWAPAVRMMWGETTRMGCGYIKCWRFFDKTKEIVNTFVLACNYAPGDEEKKKIYEKGDACSGCPSDTQCKSKSIYPKLCAAAGDPEDDSVNPPPGPTPAPKPTDKTEPGPITDPHPTDKTDPNTSPGPKPDPTADPTDPTVTIPTKPASSSDALLFSFITLSCCLLHFAWVYILRWYLPPMVIWKWLIVLKILVKSSFTQKIDWCSKELECEFEGGKQVKNVLCGNEPVVKENYTNLMTDEYKKFLLKQHNDYRNTLAKGNVFKWTGPSNMRQFTWDFTLEKMATRSAFRCTTDPDEYECRKTPDHPVVGQNYDGATNPRPEDPPPIEESVKSWMKSRDEADLDPDTIIFVLVNEYKPGLWSPAIRMMWADTYRMGCGYVSCVRFNPRVKWYTIVVLACNYAPGEEEKKSVYTRGAACSECPQGTGCNASSIYPELCALPGDPTNDDLQPTTTIPPPPVPPPPVPPTPSLTYALFQKHWIQHLLLYISLSCLYLCD